MTPVYDDCTVPPLSGEDGAYEWEQLDVVRALTSCTETCCAPGECGDPVEVDPSAAPMQIRDEEGPLPVGFGVFEECEGSVVVAPYEYVGGERYTMTVDSTVMFYVDVIEPASEEDSGGDAGSDSGSGGDAGTDSGGDAGTDSGGDAGTDSGGDAGTDSAGGDMGGDAGGGTGGDAGGDAGTGGDAGADAGEDGGDSGTGGGCRIGGSGTPLGLSGLLLLGLMRTRRSRRARR